MRPVYRYLLHEKKETEEYNGFVYMRRKRQIRVQGHTKVKKAIWLRKKNLGKKRDGVVTLTSNILLKKETDEKELNSEKRIS